MKRPLIICVVLFTAVCCFAGDYYGNDFILIDSVTNAAYYSVGETGKKSSFTSSVPVCNVQINDIKKKRQTYIFPDNNTDFIELFFFEERFDAQKNEILYCANTTNRYGGAPDCVKNNTGIAAASVSNNIIIRTKNKSGRIQFWLCGKDGSGLKSIYQYSEKDFVRYYADAQLKKLIFIKQTGNKNTVTEIDY